MKNILAIIEVYNSNEIEKLTFVLTLIHRVILTGFYLTEQNTYEIKLNAVVVLLLHTNVPCFALNYKNTYFTIGELSVI